MILFRSVVFFFIILLSICMPTNINNSFSSIMRGDIANLLVGANSSNFPSSSMLNYILFGTNEIGYYLYEFLESYGHTVDSFAYGNLIIGNDATLAGICVETGKVVIPIPFSTIQSIPYKLLGKYFPKGFTILRNDNVPNKSYDGYLFGTLGGLNLCNPCSITFSTFDKDFIEEYSVFNLIQQKMLLNPYINLFGYFQQFNYTLKQGKLMTSFYDSSSNDTYQLLDPNHDNSIKYIIDFHGTFIFSGNIFLKFNNSLQNYSFTGEFDTSS